MVKLVEGLEKGIVLESILISSEVPGQDKEAFEIGYSISIIPFTLLVVSKVL